MQQILLVIIASLSIYGLYRYSLRNPTRTPPSGDNLVSPADGKVIAITPYHTKETIIKKGQKLPLGFVRTLTKDIGVKGHIISIFMSPLDVHYNRAPISGKIIRLSHHSGKLYPSNKPLALFTNERTEIVIQGKATTIKVIQIAGLTARRIKTSLKVGDVVIKGQLIGNIQLGSQVSIIVPDNIKLQVKEGQKLTAGESIIAKL